MTEPVLKVFTFRVQERMRVRATDVEAAKKTAREWLLELGVLELESVEDE